MFGDFRSGNRRSSQLSLIQVNAFAYLFGMEADTKVVGENATDQDRNEPCESSDASTFELTMES